MSYEVVPSLRIFSIKDRQVKQAAVTGNFNDVEKKTDLQREETTDFKEGVKKTHETY